MVLRLSCFKIIFDDATLPPWCLMLPFKNYIWIRNSRLPPLNNNVWHRTLCEKKKKSSLRPLSFETKLDWLIDWLIGVICQLLHYFSYIMVFKLGWKWLLMVFFELLIQSSLVLGVTPADGRLVLPKAVEKGLLYSIKL